MFVALDANGNRVYSDEGIRYTDCVCPACGNKVIHRMGEKNRHHFAHRREVATCPYEREKDYKSKGKSEWHYRMQSYFPKSQWERSFVDEQTKEVHIADIFIEETNTVIEFQYSRISDAEFNQRTQFYLNRGFRIAWFFNESLEDSFHKYGKFVKENYRYINGPYSTKEYRWIYRRTCIDNDIPIDDSKYSICVFTGTEGDIFHRVIHKEYEHITMSLHEIVMSDMVNVDEAFTNEGYWKEQEPWKSQFDLTEWEIDKKRKTQGLTITFIEPSRSYSSKAYYQPSIPFDDQKFLKETQEKVRKYEEKERKKQDKESLDEEDRLRTLVEYFDDLDRYYNGKK